MLYLRRSLALNVYLIAGFLAAAIPTLIGYLIFKTNPTACYDSMCALPLLLTTSSTFGAVMLAIAFALNRRFERRFPDGWIPTILISTCVGQAVISVVAILLASRNIRRNFFSDILFFPQGLVVGFMVASVFWAALYVLGCRSKH